MSTFRIDVDALKDPSETLPVEINAYELCVQKWQPNRIYAAAATVRPLIGTGFVYLCTVGGTSGAYPAPSLQPAWPRELTTTVQDGSVTWQCVAASVTAINAITGVSAVSDPVGITISAPTVADNCLIRTTYAGGTVDTDYDAVFSFTLNSVPRVARHRIMVRKR